MQLCEKEITLFGANLSLQQPKPQLYTRYNWCLEVTKAGRGKWNTRNKNRQWLICLNLHV